MRGAIASMLLAGSLFSAMCGHAQATAPATYDVSTVKPSAPGKTAMRLNFGHAELTADNITLAWILQSAFHARKDQISGTPDWAKEQHYDISAKLLDADPATVEKFSMEQRRALLLALLVERFGLKYHVETKDMATYDLLPSKKGLKLTAAAYPGDKTKHVYDMCSGCSMYDTDAVTGHDIALPVFAELLANSLERTVNDRTGYSGTIDFKLKWAPDLGTKPTSDEDAAPPPLPQALEEQMGLHLQPSRGPVKVYVVDHLDKPNDN